MNRRSSVEVRKMHFIQQSINKFGDRFDYNKVVYINNNTPVTIICEQHGEFEQRPANHLISKEGCYQCGKNRAGYNHRLSLSEFLSRARDTHGEVYNYDKVEYVGAFIPVIITCTIHGEFVQTPNDHCYHGAGCSQCTLVSNLTKGERNILDILEAWGISVICQQTFDGLLANDQKSPLRYDFYLPDFKTLIEFDGPHHYQPTRYKGVSEEQAESVHRLTVEYDGIKTSFAENNGMRLLRIPYTRSKAEISKQLIVFKSQPVLEFQ